MQKISIITSDCVIWNKEQVLFDLINAVLAGPVTIDLKYEGPCCRALGLDSLLDQVIQHTGVSQSSIVIHTSNQCSSSKFKEHRLGFVELELAKKISAKKEHVPSTLNKLFGIFIGRSNWQRLGLASYLFVKYHKNTNITYHYDHNLDFFNNNFGIEELIVKKWNSCHEVFEFIPHLPLKSVEHTYPILWNESAFELTEQYIDIFCEIVCETYFTGKTFFFTEKLMRCILNRRPFIVQGPQYFLSNLKKLGFQTFDKWWDEGYSIDNPDAMFDSIKQNIDWIAEQTPTTISNWYNEMQPILEHNFRTLQNLTNSKITSTHFDFYD